MKVILRDALLTVLLSILAGIIVNTVRDEGLEWVARQDYEILVPCPEPVGEVISLAAEQAWPLAKGDLIIDSRSKDEFEKWNLPGSISIPFDYLSPVTEENLKQLIKSGARRIVVVGDGQVPDTGEELAKELSGQGMKNVHFILGGMDEMKKIAQSESHE